MAISGVGVSCADAARGTISDTISSGAANISEAVIGESNALFMSTA